MYGKRANALDEFGNKRFNNPSLHDNEGLTMKGKIVCYVVNGSLKKKYRTVVVVDFIF